MFKGVIQERTVGTTSHSGRHARDSGDLVGHQVEVDEHTGALIEVIDRAS